MGESSSEKIQHSTEDDFCSGCRNVRHNQQFFFRTTLTDLLILPGSNHLLLCSFLFHRLKEGAEFLARHGFDGREDEAEHCEADKPDEQEEQRSDDSDKNEPSPERFKRQSTMAVTAKVLKFKSRCQ